MEPFLGEIRLMAFGTIPKGWAPCNGQTLPIVQNQALFALLGVSYGGDGVTTFKLPDLRGRVPLDDGILPGSSESFVRGQAGGEESHTLTTNEVPPHQHAFNVRNADDAGTTPIPPGANAVLAQAYAIRPNGGTTPVKRYSKSGASATLAPNTIGPNSGGQPHLNMQPYLAMNFCIATQGIFPPRP